MNEIRGRIAAILGNREVAINRGKAHGVSPGMVFGIKLTIPDIVDPDDASNVLSGLYYTKGKIRIETVQDKMSFGSILPIRTYTASSLTSTATLLGLEEKAEYPPISGQALLDQNAWKIRTGDEVYLLPAEKEQGKKG